jgi:hypothetical protein
MRILSAALCAAILFSGDAWAQSAGGGASGSGGATGSSSSGSGGATSTTTPSRLGADPGRPSALGSSTTDPLRNDPLRGTGAERLSDPRAAREDSRLPPGGSGSRSAITGPAAGIAGGSRAGSAPSSALPPGSPSGGSPRDTGGSFGTPGATFGSGSPGR